MNTKTKAILASTLLTALFVGQSAIAGQDNDEGVFAQLTANTESVSTDKVNYIAPIVEDDQVEAEEIIVSGRK